MIGFCKSETSEEVFKNGLTECNTIVLHFGGMYSNFSIFYKVKYYYHNCNNSNDTFSNVNLYFLYIFAADTAMKGFLLILSLFLSCLFSDGGQTRAAADGKAASAVFESSGQDSNENEADFSDLAILPARTASYSGDGNGFAPSLRSTNNGRRVLPSSRSSSRFIRDGKVFDRNNLDTFQTAILRFQSGINSHSRYIHSICQLLI